MIDTILFKVVSSWIWGYGWHLICVLLITLLFMSIRRRHGIPPGPPLLPVFGNMFTLFSRDTNGTLQKLRDKYGDIFSLYIGQELVIVLNGYSAIHGALVGKGRLFANRPRSAFQRLVMDDSNGILFCNGSAWKERRRFTEKTLKEICFSNKAQYIQGILREEVGHVLQKLDEIHGEINITHFTNVYALNVICRVVYGNRFNFDDENALYLINAFHDIGMQVAKMQVMVNCFPFLQHLPGDGLGLKKLNLQQLKLSSLNVQFSEQSQNDQSSNRFVDAFQDEITNAESKPNSSCDTFSHFQKVHTCSDLIGAASDTTANAIMWVLLYLVREQDIQEKMFQEIQATIGTQSEVELDDREQLPYIRAVILEGMRIASSTPLALPHSVSENIMYNNYLFPKDSTVLVNLTSVLKDPTIFEEPDVFKPERFLVSDHSEVFEMDEFIPFSLGPRHCLGESLARMELFMIISGLIQKFQLLPAEAEKLPDTVGQLSTVYKPLPFSVRLVKRTTV